MRSLTFGVLIVVIGTFAALPFRRYRATQQPLPLTEATGPTQSALGGLEFEMLVEDSTLEAGFPSLALPTAEAWQSPKRQIRMPLTYDDLGVPLMLPPAFHENFSATSTAQAAKADSTTTMDAAPSRLETATVASESRSMSTPLRAGANSVLVADGQPASTETTSTRLISSPAVEPVPQRIPESAPTKQRHWIRQP